MVTATLCRDTSIAAYRSMGPRLSSQQRTIIAFLARHASRDYTRAELAEAIPMRLTSICGRVNELLKLHILIERPRRPDRHTGIAAHPVTLPPFQADMFGEAA